MERTIESLEGIITNSLPALTRPKGTFKASDRTKPYMALALDLDPRLIGSYHIPLWYVL